MMNKKDYLYIHHKWDKSVIMLLPLFCLLLSTDTVPPGARDSIKTETMREVVVHGKSGELQVVDVIEKALKQRKEINPKTPTVGDVLDKYAPTFQDKMLHPFAFKQRKKERRRRKMRRLLEQYDQIKPFNELLDEAVRRQQLEDAQKACRDSVKP